jgi:iron complex outermembrane recepter protein
MKYWLLGTTALLAAQPVQAQPQTLTDKAALDDIVVTAQRREQTLQDVPVAVSVFSGDFIERSRTATISDLVAFTPGVSGTTVAQTTPRITVRGVSTEDFGAGSDPALGIYVDDVYLGRGVSSVADLFDVARVEIVKGPQGTLFGRNTTAGAISIVTARPDETLGGFIDTSIGRFDQINLRGAINLPLGEGVALRVAGSHRERDGFVANTLGGRIGAIDSQAIRATLGLDRSGTEATISYEYRNTRGQPGPYINPFLVGTDRFGPITSNLIDRTADAARDNLESHRMTFRLESPLSDAVQLTSITAYNGFTNSYLEDTDASPATLLHFGTQGRQDSFSQELRLNGDAGELTWFIGASAALDDIASIQFAIISEESVCGVRFGSDCTTAIGVVGDPAVREASVARSSNSSYAVYGDLTFAVNAQLDLIAGLRFSRDVKDFSVGFPPAGNALGPIVVVAPALATLAQFGTVDANGTLQQRYRSSSWQPRAALNYRFSDRVSIYASASRGYKAGGFNQLSPGPAFDPESIWNYEIGLKGETADRRLRFDLTAYRFDYSDLQVLVNFGGSVVTRNAARARGTGVEASLTARPVAGLTVSGGAAWQDVNYGAFIPSPAEDFSGNRLVRSPEWSANMVADVDTPMVGELRALARAEFSYRSSQFFRPSNTAFERQEGYALINGSLGLGFGETLTFRLFVQNLFNARYLVDASTTIPNFLAYTQRGEPRTYGLQLGARF